MNFDKPLHILRFGTIGDKKHIKNAISSYDCLGINGNSAAYITNAISQFIAEDFFNKNDKGYFIDPITYSFQEVSLLMIKQKDNSFQLKNSISKLVDEYQEPISIVKKNESLTPSCFSSVQLSNDFCKRVLDFQFNLVYDKIKESDLFPFLEFINSDLTTDKTLRPSFLIAPYFYLDPNKPFFEDWLDLNIQMIDYSIEYSNNLYNKTPLFAQLVLNKNILTNEALISKIAERYHNLKIKGINIWIDDFDEHSISLSELKGFINLLSKLGNYPKYNMYGGFFSILLTHNELQLLNGVSHGLEYGESRAVFPVGGGIPTSKYYYYPIHKRLHFKTSLSLLSQDNILDMSQPDWGLTNSYYDKICNCSQCHKIMNSKMINFLNFESQDSYTIKRKNGTVVNKQKASAETKKNCLYHYLYSKQYEFNYVSKTPLSVILTNLTDNYNHFSDLNEKFEYLNNWVRCIEDYNYGK